MKKHSGRVALITGAGSGLGEATAILLGQEGAHVVLVSRTPAEIEAVAEKIIEHGAHAVAIAADVASEGDMQRVIDTIDKRWGRLDIVFANAGVNGVWAPLDELTLAEWEETIRINLTGSFLTVRAALPLLKRRGGSVVITASVNGTRMFSNTGATAYACSKAGQVALAKMLAVELARDRIRVNVICPGYIGSDIEQNTEKRDLERVQPRVEFPEGPIPLTGKCPGKASQVARLVSFLACDEADHITGTEMYIDGAQSLLQG